MYPTLFSDMAIVGLVLVVAALIAIIFTDNPIGFTKRRVAWTLTVLIIGIELFVVGFVVTLLDRVS